MPNKKKSLTTKKAKKTTQLKNITKQKLVQMNNQQLIEKNTSTYSASSFINFVNNNLSLIFLMAVMLVTGFIGGSMYTENQYLKGNKGTSKTLGAVVQPTTANVAAPEGPSVETLKKVPQVTQNDHLRGNKNAKITLIEYSDYECPYCNRYHPTMLQIMDEYPDIAWVYRHYPLPFHQNAQKAAETAECVAKYGGNELFWQFSDQIYSKIQTDTTITNPDNLLKLVVELGLNQSTIQNCLDQGEMTEIVKKQAQDGQTAGISGTPGTIIVTSDGQYELIPGAYPYDQIKAILDKYL